MSETYEQVEKERDGLRAQLAELEHGRQVKPMNRFAITQLPWICAFRDRSTGKPTLIIRGAGGFIPAVGVIVDPDKFNHRLGIDAYQATAMEAGSMFGWGGPGCDPNEYRKDGLRPITGSYTNLEKVPDPEPSKFEINPKSPQSIADQIVTAFEGGSNYFIDKVIPITGILDLKEKPWYSDLKFYEGDFKIEIVTNNDDPTKEYFDREKYEKGLGIMKEKYPQHWDDLIHDNADAETSDVVIQCALFGEVVYG